MLDSNNLNIVKIKDLLKENLTIPEYQRPYRWSKDSAITLLTDCYSAFENNVPEYRIGSLILHRNDNKELNIVDGQQRVTTMSIMFFIFNKLTKHQGLEEISLLSETYNELSIEAIVNNFDILSRKINEINKERLPDFIDYILNKCTFVKIITNNEQEAFQFFDSQNSRGKELAPHDLLKSYHLREMVNEPESTKIEIINSWENTKQDELVELFSDNLYPLVRWYKNKNGLNYSTKHIKTFKGIQKSNKFNYSIYNRAANLYIEKFNSEGMYELSSGNMLNQFQLTQPLIAGKRFFQYSLHYKELYKNIDTLVKNNFKDGEIVQNGSGDSYVYNMFINVLMFYVDRFNMESLTDARLFFFYKWAFSLRLCMITVYRESVNNYSQGKSKKVNKKLNMFSLISEMQDPMELDTIVLEYISKRRFQDSGINNERYEKMYDALFGKGEMSNYES